jgi:hypothetical protein
MTATAMGFELATLSFEHPDYFEKSFSARSLSPESRSLRPFGRFI